MAVVYRFVLNSEEQGRASILVTNQLLDTMGITAEQLHKDAMEIAPQLNPAEIREMSEVMVEMMGPEQAEMMGISNGDRKYSALTLFLDRPVFYHYYIGGRSEIICVEIDTLEALTKSEANVFFDTVLDYGRNKYGYSDDDYFSNHELWLNENGDIVTFVSETVGEDEGCSVVFNRAYPSEMGLNIANEKSASDIAEELAGDSRVEDTWGELEEENGGELVYDTLTEEQQDLVNYPELDKSKVYWTPNGKCYHSVDWCYTLAESEDIRCGTLEEAIAEGKSDPCSKCVGN